MMKIRLWGIVITFVMLGFCSCDNGKSDVGEEFPEENVDFSSTTKPLRVALDGIYSMLGRANSYGQELTWGLVSVLSKDYINTSLPLDYKDYNLGINNNIISYHYNIIDNVNNMLQYVEKTETDGQIFEYGKLERNMFIAELYGLRALLHFDLLRLFAPAPINDDGKVYIPYYKKYPESLPTMKLTVSDAMDKIEADLISACDLLIDVDTSSTETDQNVGPYGIFSGPARFQSSWVSSVNKGLWFARRGVRMNFYAAKALLMRLYMWKGDKAKVIETSKSIIFKDWFALNTSNSWSTSGNKLYYDFLMAAYNLDLGDIYATACGTSTTKYFQYDNKFYDELFAADKEDYRGKLMNSVTNDYRSLRWMWPAGATITQKEEMSLAPIIKLSEVYLMLVEAYADTDLFKAVEILNQFRSKRNAKRILKLNTKEELLKELELEWAREFQSEGQRFFFYKRLNKAVYQGESKERYDYGENKNGWVLPFDRWL